MSKVSQIHASFRKPLEANGKKGKPATIKPEYLERIEIVHEWLKKNHNKGASWTESVNYIIAIGLAAHAEQEQAVAQVASKKDTA